jgi:hypothetical protein
MPASLQRRRLHGFIFEDGNLVGVFLMHMTSTLRATGFAVLLAAAGTTCVQAGGMAEPIVEAEAITQPETIAEDAASSAPSPILLGLIALVLVAAVASGGGSGGTFD